MIYCIAGFGVLSGIFFLIFAISKRFRTWVREFWAEWDEAAEWAESISEAEKNGH